MDKFSVEEITQKNIWERFVLSQSPKTFLQSWNWGEVNRVTGSKIFRLGFRNNGKIIGTCLLIKERARRGPHLLIPAGPFIDWENKKLVKFFVKTIIDLANKEKVWFVRMRPELISSSANILRLSKLGFKSAPMHLHAENTWVLDISKSEDELLSKMRKTTRYLIKKGEKSDLELVINNDPKMADILFELQKVTAERHGFVGFSKKLFEKEIDLFGKDGNANVFLCKKGNEDLAIAIIVFYGNTAYYHFSASVSDHRDLPFSYFLQWQVIKVSKERGSKFYNFWGIAPNNDPKHRFAGVTLFKTGFGGQRIDWLHAHDLPVSPLYWLTYVFESGRRMFRHL